MQVLYSFNRDEALTYPDAYRAYLKAIDDSYHAYLFAVLHLKLFVDANIRDYTKRQAKHIQKEEDKAFQARMSKNAVMKQLWENTDFADEIKSRKVSGYVDDNIERLLYQSVADTTEFIDYTYQNSKLTDKEFAIFLAKHLIQNEDFAEHAENCFPTWLDDKSLVFGSLKKTFKAGDLEGSFFGTYRTNQETISDFGKVLLSYTYKEDAELLTLIGPILQNWDADRVSVIDMILIKMAITEMLHFESIPVKVTLNEYLELAKNYSSAKSKDFLNGVLDRIMKTLQSEGKIEKTGRGLIN